MSGLGQADGNAQGSPDEHANEFAPGGLVEPFPKRGGNQAAYREQANQDEQYDAELTHTDLRVRAIQPI